MKTKILKITGIVFAVLVIFVWASPYLFKGKITSLIKSQITKDLRAHVTFSNVDISLFRNFPKFSVGLDNLVVTCVGEFQDDTLLVAKQLDMSCNLNDLMHGHGIQINSITVHQPVLNASVSMNCHANWNIFRSNTDLAVDSAVNTINWALQRYTIHNGSLKYFNEGKNIRIEMHNIEQDASGNFNLDQFDLKTKTSMEMADLQYTGSFPYKLSAKTNVNVTIHVNSKTHTFTFNTDQLVFNELKLHTEGFFQWINDSSYNMNISYKVPSTDFKNLLGILPSVYQKDFSKIEASGNANFNGFIRGKYDSKHNPAYHTNLYVMNGFFKYPDQPLGIEHINLGLQINNPDGIAEHLAINVSDAHAEVQKDTIDMHLQFRNVKAQSFIDFALKGRLDFSNVSKCLKMDPGTKINGILRSDLYAKGNVPDGKKKVKDKFQSGGDFQLLNFTFVSKDNPRAIQLDSLLMSMNAANVVISKLDGSYGQAHVDVAGILSNVYDYAMNGKPLNANLNIKSDEVNLRDWTGIEAGEDARKTLPVQIPANINFTVNAEAEKFHFDNLDLQNVSCQMVIADQTVHLLYVKAKGLDGDIVLDGTYSTLENREHPTVTMNYDVKGVDIQKTFLAFNSIRRIMPVAKFMTGNVDAHMTLNGQLNEDMTTDLASLQGQGTVLLLSGTIKDFGPMDKLAQSLDVKRLKNMPLKDVKADFSYKNGSVIVSPFVILAKDMEFDIEGVHSFEQSIDYEVSLKMPREELGKKGNRFVKNVVDQAAKKGIPVRIKDAVRMDIKMAGTINNPDVKTDMDAVVSNAESDLKKEVDEFIHAKLDSAKEQLHATPHKKPVFVQTSYKSKSKVTPKKTAKKTVKKANKKTTHSKPVKKKKKSSGNYTNSSKKDRRTAVR